MARVSTLSALLQLMVLLLMSHPSAYGHNPSAREVDHDTGSRTYVLVHGGFGGGWVWKDVASLLRKAGHEVYTPALTGLGERAHLARPDVDLNTHIQDVVAVLEYNRLDDVILVGHSYAGMVITGVADRVPDRLAHLVYLDAVVPRNGEAMVDFYDPAFVEAVKQHAEAEGDGWRISPVGPMNPPDPRWTAHPMATMTQPVEISDPELAGVPRTYIDFTLENGDASDEVLRHAAERARRSGWTFKRIDALHNALLTGPANVAGLLLQLE